jgi:hypothetical protein
MKKNVLFTGILAIMLVFGFILVSCETDTPDPTRTHEFEYKPSSGTLTITGEGESSKPKTGDSFTLETADGKKVTGTIEVSEDGTITFKKEDKEVFPKAKIDGDDLKIEEKGEIIFDGGGGKREQPAETAKPPLYKASWAYMGDATYSDAVEGAKTYGVTFNPAGSNAGYVTGDTAVNTYNIMKQNVPNDETGSIDPCSFEDLLAFENQGMGWPEDLKSALRREKANMPIAAVFQVNQGSESAIVVIYVEED